MAWPPQTQWGGDWAVNWDRLLVPEVGPGVGVVLMVAAVATVAVVFVPVGGAADYM